MSSKAKLSDEDARDVANFAKSARTNGEEGLTAGVPLARFVPYQIKPPPQIVALTNPDSAAAERFRRLMTRIKNEYGQEAQVIVVTSASPAEGKTSVATNLALTFAAAGEETLLVDADLRRPNVVNWLTPRPGIGLAEILAGRAGVDHGILTLKNVPLKTLPTCRSHKDPVQLLASSSCRELMGSLRERFDRIIVDTPPVLLFTDADSVGALADGVIMVARSRVTPKSRYAAAVSSITSTRVLGTVINDVSTNFVDAGSRYSDYYQVYYKQRRDE